MKLVKHKFVSIRHYFSDLSNRHFVLKGIPLLEVKQKSFCILIYRYGMVFWFIVSLKGECYCFHFLSFDQFCFRARG